MTFWQCVLSILKSESSMEDIANLLVKGLGCVIPVIMIVGGEATNGQAFFTMGTPEMLKKGGMSRVICPGMSNRHHDGQKNNTHSVPYNGNHLVSPTHCIIIDTNTAGQSQYISNDNDGIYVGMKSGSLTTHTNIINSCSFTQPHVESEKLCTSTSSVNCVPKWQSRT